MRFASWLMEPRKAARYEAFHQMIAKAGGTAGSKVDAVVIRTSGADGYNDYLFEMVGVDSVESLVIKTREAANSPRVNAIMAGRTCSSSPVATSRPTSSYGKAPPSTKPSRACASARCPWRYERGARSAGRH